MSQFRLDADIASAEYSLKSKNTQLAPLMRWQRRALESSLSNLNLSQGSSKSNTSLCSLNQSTDGLMALKSKMINKKKGDKTPIKTSGAENTLQQDRYIPNRSTTDFDYAHHAIKSSENIDPEEEVDNAEYDEAVQKACGVPSQEVQILSYKSGAVPRPSVHTNNLQVIYNSAQKSIKQANARYVNQKPDHILDAPELIDDYYLNLMDWSSKDQLALGLLSTVYIWNTGPGTIIELSELEGSDNYVSSVKWTGDGNTLAAGTARGEIQIWDVNNKKVLRTMAGHSSRIGSLSWNSYILSSGSRSGCIHHHDVRVAQHHVGTLTTHTSEICGLAWSPDGKHLASGANDNLLCVWDTNLGEQSTPLHTFTAHMAAVKALSWCPWQHNILASGGGTADRHIRFWNITTGSALHSVDTLSQVCSILWSPRYKEIISGHGFNKNQLTIWKYPTMTKVTELQSHVARILNLSMSGDGTTVASLAADETVRIWKCFPKEQVEKAPQSTQNKKSGPLTLTMR